MASTWLAPPPPKLRLPSSSSGTASSVPLSIHSLSFAPAPHRRRRFNALKTRPLGSEDTTHDASSSDSVPRKPAVSPFGERLEGIFGKEDYGGGGGEGRDDDGKWIDWEDLILEDTAPLVVFVKMILHSGKYKKNHRLSPLHEKAIIEKLLPYHPQFAKKIGCGIDYIKVGYHPDFEDSRCLFVVQKNGEHVDFSYWKCIKGFIEKNYPLFAPSFLRKHFRWNRHYKPRLCFYRSCLEEEKQFSLAYSRLTWFSMLST